MNWSILVFISYIALLFWIAFRALRASTDTADDVHLASRSLTPLAAALSASASTESGFVLLGMVGAGYSMGVNALWIIPAGVMGYLLLWVFVAPRLQEKSEEVNSRSLPSFISLSTQGTSFSKMAGSLAGAIAVIFLITYSAAQLTAAGKAFEGQFGVDHLAGIVICSVIILGYLSVGGIRASVWTDVLQALVMFFCLIIIPGLAIVEVGGIGSLFAALQAIDPALVDPFKRLPGEGKWVAVLAWLMLGLAYPGQPHAVSRIMAMKSATKTIKPAMISTLWFVSIYTGAVMLGLAAKVGFSELPGIADDPEQILPLVAALYLPTAVAGIVMAAIFSAIASTTDSTVYTAASIVNEHSIVDKMRSKLGPWKLQLTLATIILLVATMASLTQNELVFTLVLYAWSGLGAALAPVMLYCICSKYPKGLAALAGISIGGVVVFLLRENSLSLLIGFGLSCFAIFVTHAFANLLESRNAN